MNENFEAIREAIADYIASEGCSCCQDTPKHEAALRRLAILLDVPEYSDGSGYDFYRYASEAPHA